MRLICPNCDAQYEIDGTLVPALGRDVECSACGQVWFQPKEPQNPNPVGPEAKPVLSRPLSDSVLSILRDEASRELRNRDIERQGSDPRPGLGDLAAEMGRDTRKEVTDAAAFVSDPLSDRGKDQGDVWAQGLGRTIPPFDIPIIDWPATTVAELNDLQPVPAAPAQNQPAPKPRYEVPPLVLPDAEKLAATLHSPQPAPEVQPTPEPQTDPEAESLAASQLDEPLAPGATSAGFYDEPEVRGDDALSLPGDAAPETVDHAPSAPRDTITPASALPVNTASDGAQPKTEGTAPLDAGIDGDKPLDPVDPNLTASPAHPTSAAKPTSEPPAAPEAPVASPSTPAAAKASALVSTEVAHLPAKIAPSAAKAPAGYRTGFGLALMLAVLALALYALAPRLAGQGEIGAQMMSWRLEVDQARHWLLQEANQLLGRD